MNEQFEFDSATKSSQNQVILGGIYPLLAVLIVSQPPSVLIRTQPVHEYLEYMTILVITVKSSTTPTTTDTHLRISTPPTLASGFCDVCVRSSTRGSCAYEPAVSKIYLSSNGPRLHARARLQTRQRRLALIGEGTDFLATNARATDGGHRGRGKWNLAEENWTLSFFFLSFSFSLLCVLSFWLPRRRGEGAATEESAHVLGRDGRQEVRLKSVST